MCPNMSVSYSNDDNASTRLGVNRVHLPIVVLNLISRSVSSSDVLHAKTYQASLPSNYARLWEDLSSIVRFAILLAVCPPGHQDFVLLGSGNRSVTQGLS